MAYRMTQLTERVYVGKMSDGSLDVEVWGASKPPHATQRDYDDNCEQVVIPSDAVADLFEYLR